LKDLKIKGLESKDGIVKLFDERIVFIPPSIITLLGQIYGEGSVPILKYLGKKMGRRLIETWEEHLHPKTLENLTEIFIDMVSASGWGNFSIVEMSSQKIQIKLSYNISREEENPSQDICYFITGLLTGFGDFAFYSSKVIEAKCSITNQSETSCIFIIENRNVE
jgi:predicted hydrocarbon binding protein